MPPTVDEIIDSYHRYVECQGLPKPQPEDGPALLTFDNIGLLVAEIERLREDKKRLDELASCPQCKLCFVPPDEPLKTKPIFDHRGRHIGYGLIDELRWCDIRCPSCSTITERRPGESR